jgi:hypothetical protein
MIVSKYHVISYVYMKYTGWLTSPLYFLLILSTLHKDRIQMNDIRLPILTVLLVINPLCVIGVYMHLE